MGERENLAEALRKQRAVLAKLEEQAAGFGSLFVPAHLLVQIDDARAKIAELIKQNGALPETDPATPTHPDHHHLAQLEEEITPALEKLAHFRHAFLNELDPRKKRRLRMDIMVIESDLRQVISDFVKAGGDPQKYSV